MYNSDQNNFDLFADYTYIKIVIVLAIDLNLFRHYDEYDVSYIAGQRQPKIAFFL